MSYIVIDKTFLNKPMVMLDYDGNRSVPKPGILFICTPEFLPTVFVGKREAAAAVKRSKKYRGEADDLDRYHIMDRGQYLEMTDSRTRQKGKGKRAKADG